MNKRQKQIIDNEIKDIRKLAEVHESYFVGLLWLNPMENFGRYANKLKPQYFLHKVWGFYYGLGLALYQKGLKNFDEISVNTTVTELEITKHFEKYGGYDTMLELMNIVKYNDDNIESYFDAVMKNYTIRELLDLYGEKVLIDTDKYSYKALTYHELGLYWNDKSNQIIVDNAGMFESENLYTSSQEFLENLAIQMDDLLPLYNAPYLNSVIKGMPRGEVTMLGGFGNSGKSSLMVDKILMSCLNSPDKTLVILNEETADKLREKLLLSIINHELNTKEHHVPFHRSKFLKVENMTEQDKKIIDDAFKKILELTSGDEAHIKIIYMSEYKIEDLKNIATLYANRGYVNLIIDTHKVPDNYKSSSRWEAFVEATKEIYKFTRNKAGGLNLRTFLNLQLADSHITDKFLSYDAIGEGKAMKNEASILMMFRPLFDDEKRKLKPYRWVNSGLNGKNSKWVKEEFELHEDKLYYVMFIPKNRNGGNTDTGQDCVLLQPNFEFNSFQEVGYVKIARNY